jgi:DNA (cytosine-5)-methyltransferase 1
MFTGVGGFELGLEGHECVGFSEIDKHCSLLLADKFEVKNYGDATKINPDELPDFDMLCGGFPCQSFSIAGRREGFNDTRGTLFFEISRIIKAKRPKIVFLENVKGLLNHDQGKTFRVIIQTLSELGYDVQWMVCNSKFFGVPQNRERVFIIGNIRGEPRPEILPFSQNAGEIPNLSKEQTIYDRKGFDSRTKGFRESVGESPTLSVKMGTGGNNVPMVMSLQPRSATRPSLLKNPKAGGHGTLVKEDETFALDSSCCQGVSVTKDNCAYALKHNPDAFAMSDIEKKRRTAVYNGTLRRLTPTECEALQSFPRGWTSKFSDTQRYKMMGNAVTVNVIRAINSKLKGER